MKYILLLMVLIFIGCENPQGASERDVIKNSNETVLIIQYTDIYNNSYFYEVSSIEYMNGSNEDLLKLNFTECGAVIPNVSQIIKNYNIYFKWKNFY